MEMFVILTAQNTDGVIATFGRTVMFDPGNTRSDIFTWAVRQLREDFQGPCSVLFFSAEHNAINPPVPGHTAAALPQDGQS